jgi:hypothetical protein
MAEISKQALKVENNQSFPNNNSGEITPSALRLFNTDMIDSTVNQLVFDAATGSWENSIDLLNQFSASVPVTISALSASLTVTDEYLQSQINALDVSGSAASVALLNAFTASQEAKDIAVGYSTASLNQFTSSQDTKNTTLASVTASLQGQLTNIGAQSGSWITESETGSFARTNASNTFTADQTINGNLNVSGTINAYKLNVTIETSSVIFSSGSNILGDSIADVQLLNGQTIVSGSLGVTGSFRNNTLLYPTTDGTFTGQVIQTDAAGTLSFGNVNAVFENIKNGESTTITVGTPLFVSGAQGSNPICYRANATDATKMPVTFVAMESITAGSIGRGITLGLITGINLTGYPVGTSLYTDGLGALTATRPTGATDIIQPIGIVTKTGNGGQLNVLNPGPVLMPNMQTGYTFVGDGTNQPVLVATSSFGSVTDLSSLNAFTASQNTKNTTLESVTSSFNAFTSSQETKNTTLANVTSSLIAATGSYATTGSNTFTGSQTISGSVLGNVTALSIASNTASMNLNVGNFFTLNLVASTATHLAASNIKAGQTINLLVTQASGGSGTLTFSPSFRQVAGQSYVPSPGSGSQDIVTFVTFDNSTIYSSYIKQLV